MTHADLRTGNLEGHQPPVSPHHLPTPHPVAITEEPTLPSLGVVEGGEASVRPDGEQLPQQHVEENVIRQLVNVPRIPRPVLIRLMLF
ncbi:hypothetical protein BLNAU_8942 [Blattamonas nauphoetae]|uniref:Uncharacterized protein n=1 Tax=Blattamonas nauphoetae TaxID=2049346 RepID=A0ABQ9XB70_9EUKA|nr:hypothetical protein BLNAU_18743 [Blattamonas nauphoetae]KAK2949778.1 hypothetical protein BLNAU_15260 [Blattamonas nauphoetae]KAK2951716.1 hypothetical protein BLNAU_13328 [Blattamonas nauphoetae]KAK2954432.1 hypothetical protein BLNAU_10600 [Blattamonas nauphoetae]KAK2956162.1 hypothetical protein BLNAU_8942 [Blattamonas nauphoetae]